MVQLRLTPERDLKIFFFNVKTSEFSLGSGRRRKARVVFRERSNLCRSISGATVS